jgi:hypothetical protein
LKKGGRKITLKDMIHLVILRSSLSLSLSLCKNQGTSDEYQGRKRDFILKNTSLKERV